MYGKGNFKRVMSFVKSMLRDFHISKKETHVALMIFSNKAKLIFNFHKYYDRKSVINRIDRVHYPQGGTRTGLALRRAKSLIFNHYSKRRKILIVLTDGVSYDSVAGPARRLRALGVEIFSLGVGKKYNKRQLRLIGSDRKHVYTSKFVDLDKVALTIRKQLCPGKYSGKVLSIWVLFSPLSIV